MEDQLADVGLSAIASAIAEPARARMLCSLMDGHARTNTELAVLAGVSPSTASVHLTKLKSARLVLVLAQGKHRYYSLAGLDVAAALEALMRIAGQPIAPTPFQPSTPDRLRHARTCYDHMAGTVAVRLHDRMLEQGWLRQADRDGGDYQLTVDGESALAALGVDVAQVHASRRRFACACLDWSERRPHLGGALGAALLLRLLKKAWVERDLDSRALGITRSGKQGLQRVFALDA